MKSIRTSQSCDCLTHAQSATRVCSPVGSTLQTAVTTQRLLAAHPAFGVRISRCTPRDASLRETTQTPQPVTRQPDPSPSAPPGAPDNTFRGLRNFHAPCSPFIFHPKSSPSRTLSHFPRQSRPSSLGLCSPADRQAFLQQCTLP